MCSSIARGIGFWMTNDAQFSSNRHQGKGGRQLRRFQAAEVAVAVAVKEVLVTKLVTAAPAATAVLVAVAVLVVMAVAAVARRLVSGYDTP